MSDLRSPERQWKVTIRDENGDEYSEIVIACGRSEAEDRAGAVFHRDMSHRRFEFVSAEEVS